MLPLENPVLVEVKASNVDKRRIAEFSMYLNLKRAEPPKDAAKPAHGAAKKG